MPSKMSIKKILKKNRQVEAKKFAQGHRLSKKLHSMGMRGRGYRLAVPYSGRRAELSLTSYTVYLPRA